MPSGSGAEPAGLDAKNAAVKKKSAITEASSAGYRARMDALNTVSDPSIRSLKRTEVILEWLSEDFNAAFDFLKSEGFKEMNPAIARRLAEHASISNLVDLASTAKLPYDALMAVGQYLDPSKTAELAGHTAEIPAENRADFAAAMASLLCVQNLDAAEKYAGSLGAGESSLAYASIIDQLVSTNHVDEARALYSQLPGTLLNSDAMLAAAGRMEMSSNPSDALSKLMQIKDVNARKVGLVAFARSEESEYPEAALTAIYSAGLSDAGVQTHAMRILQNWGAYDRDAALAFARTSPLISSAAREQLVNTILAAHK